MPLEQASAMAALPRKSEHGTGVSRRLVIRKMIEKEPEISFTEIARRIGISRERVRQLVSERDPRRAKRLAEARRSLRFRKSVVTVLGEVVAICYSKNLRLEAIPRKYDSRALYSSCKINGYLCRLGRVSSRRSFGHLLYLAIQSPKERNFDFWLGKSEIGWFVFPVSSLPRIAASFSPERSTIGEPGVGKSSRHDYLDYFEAWNLLGSPVEVV